MVISSRTPEGDPNTCPVCLQDVRIDPSTVPRRDAPCPHCGHLLDFTDHLNLDDLFAPPEQTGVANSFEKELLGIGTTSLGSFPYKLHDDLLKAIADLALKGRLPSTEELASIIASSNSWQGTIDLLRQLANCEPPEQRKGIRVLLARMVGFANK